MLDSLSLFALALLFLVHSDAALGAHFNCSWRPGEGSPSQLHYLRFCEAGATNIADFAADYDCLLERSVKPREAPKVADWGKYASGVLEWLSPCGGNGGYGKKDDGSCMSDHWALCIGQGPRDCLYMAAEDDCQWPKIITVQALPKTIEVWYHVK